ncbi:uncharacterized protein LOC115734980 [Rhodamnia argentea]|uniref:Uncharacterized protein LOC115734980 n=1 Tax=Rhodamnia argentea TaxID=178133 RepID=A0A8B8NHC3_9MYRT|nr:uncharacterized protein LOC115734980 [Rhodamnia argentea]
MGPPSPSNPPSAPPNPQVDADVGDSAGDAEDRKPDSTELSPDSNDAGDIEKYRKYEADYTQRLMAKYFSKKTIYGGDIFDEKLTIDGEVIKSSRWPYTRSYADTVNSFEDQSWSDSASAAETAMTISNGKHPLKKSG